MTADFKQSANLAGKILASGQIAAAAADTTIYTVPAVSAVKVATFVLTNISGAVVTISVSVVPNGSAIDATRRIVSTYALAAGDSTKITELEASMLDAGAFVSVQASAAASINYLMTGAVAS